MCNYLNKYTNSNDAHYFRYTSFMKNVQKMYSLFVWYIFKTVQQFTMVSKHTLVQISLYPWLNGQYICFHTKVKKIFFLKFNAKNGAKLFPPLNF